jgi:hypothetical protein
MTRYYGWYASRTRGTRARLASDGRRLTADGLSVDEPVAITDPVNWSLRATAPQCFTPEAREFAHASSAPGGIVPYGVLTM